MGTVAIFESNRGIRLSGGLFSLPQAQRQERVVAVARVVLASALFLGVHFDPSIQGIDTSPFSSPLSLYVLYSFFILSLTLVGKGGGAKFGISAHVLDVLWPPVIYLFAPESQRLVFVPVVLFALLAAAYRWGLWETLATGVASALFFMFRGVVEALMAGHASYLSLGEVGSVSMAINALCLVALAGFLGYLTEREKRLRIQTAAVSRIMQQTSTEANLSETFEDAFCAILTLFHARRVAVALKEIGTQRVFLWEATRAMNSRPISVNHCEIEPPEQDRYFFQTPGDCWYLRSPRRGAPGRYLALGAVGHRLRNIRSSIPETFYNERKFRRVLATDFSVRNDWSGRLFLFDSPASVSFASDLRHLRTTVQQLAPAVHGVYLLRRLRSRARATERAHVARELHDGVIQTLSALEMRLELLRRRAAMDVSPQLADGIGDVQRLLRFEILDVRGLMQKFNLRDLCSSQLLNSMADVVERFQRDTGISASFTAETDKVELSSRVCREVALIVLEALANVRKHSRACKVWVRFECVRNLYNLVIQDDGRGFEFTGRLTQAELEASRKGPKVLGERVKLIQGEYVIESIPEHGATIEVRFPREA